MIPALLAVFAAAVSPTSEPVPPEETFSSVVMSEYGEEPSNVECGDDPDEPLAVSCVGVLPNGYGVEALIVEGVVVELTVNQETPETDLGRAVLQCVTEDPDLIDSDFEFFDDGRSVVIYGEAAQACTISSGDVSIPEWVLEVQFVGVLTFGEWSVILDLEDGDLVVMESEVAPD